jgi:hypothetical protein
MCHTNHVLSLSQKLGKAKKFGKLDASDIEGTSKIVQTLVAAMQKVPHAPEEA